MIIPAFLFSLTGKKLKNLLPSQMKISNWTKTIGNIGRNIDFRNSPAIISIKIKEVNALPISSFTW
jgi:hypothetical protein